MKRQPRVVWSSGIFLTPQIFEAQERFFESEMQFRSSLDGFAKWGVSELDVDTGALANGVFRLTKCVGVFVDGFAFSMPDAEPLPPQRDFAFDGENLAVFLAIPERRESGLNISNPGGEALRFTSRDQTIYADLDGQEETVQIAEPHFKFVFAGESTAGLDTLPIARIIRSIDGGYSLDPKYIPPCLNASCSSYLWDTLLMKLLNRLLFVSTQLTAQRSKRSELLADFGDSDIRRFWVLHLVNRALPELKHIHGIEYCHPEELYRFLLRFGGALFTFWGPDEANPKQDHATSRHFGITGFPTYDHRDLGGCLIPVVIQLEEMLKTMVYRKRRCQVINLIMVQRDRHFKGNVTTEDIQQGAFYLGVKKDPSVTPTEIDDSLKVVGSVTSGTASTLAGLQISLESRAPADCAQREGYVYYRVVQPSAAGAMPSMRQAAGGASGRTASREENLAVRRFEVWQDIVDNGELHLVILNPAKIPHLELLVVGPATSGHAPLRDESA